MCDYIFSNRKYNVKLFSTKLTFVVLNEVTTRKKVEERKLGWSYSIKAAKLRYDNGYYRFYYLATFPVP